MSLVQRAEEGKLPLHQNIDNETLRWIKDNEPQELKEVGVTLIARSIDIEKVSQFIPLTSWFASLENVNSLHGIRHLVRVSTYAWMLSENIYQKQRNSLLIATALHDIRRLDDKGDKGHANRAAKWYEKNKSEVLCAFELDTVDDRIVAGLIKTHEYSYDDLKYDGFYLKHGKLVDILKTSDALDRYIQPKKKWWLNENYLKIKPGLKLKAFAFNLIIESEQNYLAGVDSKKAVVLSVKKLQSY
ncbi:hypothetical protein C4578_02415 [Candidatus Microgenomates bacterium]|jgi:hypothetical protein|nr:MAG: hypothetical protein C4578_02415 [Candidatus Microgenomates bacterium]